MKSVSKMGIWLFVIVALFIPIVFSCSGGGGDGNGNPPQTSSTINGVASKGLISGGNVAVYEIDENGQKVTPALASGTTGSDGSYSLSINYSGPVLVEVTSGSYIDEATGETENISQPLRAAMVSVDGDVQVAVTPLTEIAVRLAEAGGGLSDDKIDAANDLLSQLLGADIIATQPADPDNSSGGFDGASSDEQDYCLLLAAISQMAETAGQDVDVMDILKALEEDLGDLELDQTGIDLLAALSEFLASQDNMTGTTDPGDLDDNLVDIMQDGLDPTGSLVEAKNLLTVFLQDPTQANYDALMIYLNGFAPDSQETYLFKALASLMNIYQSDAADFITSGENGLSLSTVFENETFDSDQFVDSLLRSVTIEEDVLGFFAEIEARLGDVYADLEQAEGVKTAISLTGFDTVYLDDVDVKILKFITQWLQAGFIFAQAVDLGVDNWMVTEGTETRDVRDLLNSGQELSEEQLAEFMGNNPDLLKYYPNTEKLTEFRTAFSQAATDLAAVVSALEAMGTAGRKARRQNAFNLDSDLDFYLTKGLSEQTATSLAAAMGDATAEILIVSDEEVGGSSFVADDGHTYWQSVNNIYLIPVTPVNGMITLYDLANDVESIRDLIEASEAVEEYEPYVEGVPELYQGGILDIDWEDPID